MATMFVPDHLKELVPEGPATYRQTAIACLRVMSFHERIEAVVQAFDDCELPELQMQIEAEVAGRKGPGNFW